MASDYLKNLIHKYLENKCSEEETGIVLNYLETPEGQTYLTTLIDRDMENPDHLLKEAEELAVSKHVLHEIHQKIATASGAERVRKMHNWYRAAASVVGLLIAFAAYQFFYISRPIVYQTAYGETKKIMLSDSTVVTLNANSMLTWQHDYDQQREVWLKGEAFFEVKHIAKAAGASSGSDAVKFVVHANNLAVEVTGTSFNVNNRNKKTQVVLNTGKVQLKTKKQDSEQQKMLNMQPGDMVEVFEDNRKIVKKVVNPMVYSSWKDNKMVCNDTPLKAVAQVIRDTYGKVVVFDSPALSQKMITGTLPTDNLDLLMNVLSASLKLEIQQNADTIFVQDTKN